MGATSSLLLEVRTKLLPVLTLTTDWEMDCGGVLALPEPPDTCEGKDKSECEMAGLVSGRVTELLPELTLTIN